MHPTIEEAKHQLLELLRSQAFAQKNVVLASGQPSSVYIDCKQILFRGDVLLAMGIVFYHLLEQEEDTSGRFQGCSGMALGAVPMCSALSMVAMQKGRYLPGIVVRKQAKEHGTSATVEGISALPSPARLVLLEDVVTTGGSSLLAIDQLRKSGYEIDTAFSLVDRNAGGKKALDKQGVRLRSLFLLDGETLVDAPN